MPDTRPCVLFVTMAYGDTCTVFPGKRYPDWPLDDPGGQDAEVVRSIRDAIEARVRGLLTEMGVPATA
ncbi:hypothetical protein [Streptomyces sp. NBC_00334]|uniref:hypothetical protein n=1 Tax=Streptomyces sp. NBC_00334 TaxID=2975713 RepID=UPI002E2C17BE|nr:hypothetical protein [Streptomyces sp. NBC_00334]